jgi:hypothetical protein
VFLESGNTTGSSSVSGKITVTTGTTQNGVTGDIEILTAAPSGGSANSGQIDILTGAGGSAGHSGVINIKTGNGGSSSPITIETGTGLPSGGVTLKTGAAGGGTSGTITIQTGTGSTRGDIILNTSANGAKLANAPTSGGGLAIASVGYVNTKAALAVQYHIYPGNEETPNNADWAVNSVAPADADSNNNGLTIWEFDDTTEEGIGYTVHIPAEATNIIIGTVSRAEVGPGSPQSVMPKVYTREMRDNLAVEGWTGGSNLTAIAIPANEFWQYDTHLAALSGLGLVAGRRAQLEFTRVGTDVSDTLVDDWDVLEVWIYFT